MFISECVTPDNFLSTLQAEFPSKIEGNSADTVFLMQIVLKEIEIQSQVA